MSEMAKSVSEESSWSDGCSSPATAAAAMAAAVAPGTVPEHTRVEGGSVMSVVLLVLLLALLLGGLGFAAHALWWIAVIVLVGWLLGFGMRLGEGSRWYRW